MLGMFRIDLTDHWLVQQGLVLHWLGVEPAVPDHWQAQQS